MSFADNFDRPQRGGASRGGGGYEFDSFGNNSPPPSSSLASSITNQIRQLSGNVGQIESMTRQIGSSKDGPQAREQLNGLIGSTRELLKDVTSNIRVLDSNRTQDKEKRIQQQKLTKDLQLWSQRFQDAYKIASDKERATPLTSVKSTQQSGNSFSKQSSKRNQDSFPINNNYEYDDQNDDMEKTSLIEANRRQQFQLGNEVEFQNNLILDRENDIKEIEKSVVEVNEIFRDISALVVDQGQMIDSIESNIEAAAETTTKGVEEQVKASGYQKSSRNKLCCLALIILVVVGALMLFIWLFVIKK